MNLVTRQRVIWIAVPLAVGLVVPSLVVFCLQVFVGHIPASAAAVDILRSQFAEGENAFLGAIFGLIPFVALSVICGRRARGFAAPRLACLPWHRWIDRYSCPHDSGPCFSLVSDVRAGPHVLDGCDRVSLHPVLLPGHHGYRRDRRLAVLNASVFSSHTAGNGISARRCVTEHTIFA